MYCPNLRREPKVGDNLVYSYFDIHTGEKILLEIPPNCGYHCNEVTGRWYVKCPLTDPPRIQQ
jgi:hypothetical protein